MLSILPSLRRTLVNCLFFFLGIEVDHTKQGLLLIQRKYIKSLLTGSSMLHAKPMPSPMTASLKLSKFDVLDFDDITLYHSLGGGLQYMSFTQPDISFSGKNVSQFLHAPKTTHWSAIKQIIRYLKATINHGLFFQPQSTFTLQVYSDADWVDAPMIVDQQEAIVFISRSIFSLGVQRNKILWLDPPLKLNTKQLLPLLLN